MNYKDQTVWITGASSGIGAELARLFAMEGARVIISSHEAEELEGVRKSLESISSRVFTVVFNLGNPEEVLGKKSERSELFAPIKFNRDAPDEGGGKFKPIDKFEKRFDPSESLKGVSSALESNNIEGVQDSIKQAFEASKGNPADFEKFGQQLQKKLADQGYDVRFGKDAVSLHRQGAENAVEFKIDGDINVFSGKLDGRVKAQSYNWQSKKDVDVDPEIALSRRRPALFRR